MRFLVRWEFHRGASRRFWFYGADYTLEARIECRNSLRKVTEDELRQFIVGKEPPPELVPCLTRNAPVRRQSGNGRYEFRILEHIGSVRKVGRNYVARSPSCAESADDRCGDNLAILIEDPRFYHCWAGCTKEMIRSARGFPIREAISREKGC